MSVTTAVISGDRGQSFLSLVTLRIEDVVLLLRCWNFRWRSLRLFPTAIALLLAVAIGWMGAGAGRSPAAADPQPIVLRALLPAPFREAMQPAIALFEAEHPEIQLELVAGPNDTSLVSDLYTTAFLLGNAPYDLVFLDVTWLPKFVAAGWLLDLSDRISPETQAEFLPATLRGSFDGDRLYRLPLNAAVGLLYYRQDLMPEPPQTFAELVARSQQLQAEGKVDWGYVWQGKQYEGLVCNFLEVLAGKGGYWIDPQSGAVGLDQPEAIAAAEWLRSTITSGITPAGVSNFQENEALKLFETGQSAFMRNWPYAEMLLERPESKVQGKVGITAMVHAPDQNSAATQGTWGVAIASQTPHPEAALMALLALTGTEAQRLISLGSNYIPTRAALYQDPELLAQYPFYAELQPILESAVLRAPLAAYDPLSDILQRHLSAVISGQMPAAIALQQAARESRQLLTSQRGGAA